MMNTTEKNLLVNLGKYLKSLREAKNISLNLFAYENDLTTATVSRIENGLVDLKFSTLVKYARALEKPLEEIIKELNITYTDTNI